MSDGRAGVRRWTRAPGTRPDLDDDRPAGQLSFGNLDTLLEEVTFVVVGLEMIDAEPGPESTTEIGAVKVRGRETISGFSTPVDPGQPMPVLITSLAGVTTTVTTRAPRIATVIPSLVGFLCAGPSTVVAAHGVRFSVGHLRVALTGTDFTWPSVRVLDMIALVRCAFSSDEVPSFKLSTLTGVRGTTMALNHRALDNARVAVSALHTMPGRLRPLGITHLEDLATAMNPIPRARRRKMRLTDRITCSPGIYRLIGPAGDILCVRSSSSLRARVHQYFTAAETRRRMAKMTGLAERAKVDETLVVFEARILELRQIAEFGPSYDRRSCCPDDRPWFTLTNEAHPRLRVTASLAMENAATILDPLGSREAARQATKLAANDIRLYTYTICLPIRPSGQRALCRLYAMGRCSTPCVLPDNPNGFPLTATNSILGGGLDDLWGRNIQRLANLAAAERFEQTAAERNRLRYVIDTARRYEHIPPLLAARQIVGVRHDDDGSWDVTVIHRDRPAATGRYSGNADPRELVAELVVSVSQTDRSAVLGDIAPIEETELLAAWLWKPVVHLLSFEGEAPLAFPRVSAFRSSPSGSDTDQAGPDAN